MTTSEFYRNISKTLMYYEIFDHPLRADELYTLLPENSITFSSFRTMLDDLVRTDALKVSSEFYQLAQTPKELSSLRLRAQMLAERRLRIAHLMTHVIKRFPFVRGVFLSGDLSKGVATAKSDIDYVIVTETGRLWICRTLLILFKKLFLLNKRKYFCLNYFVAEDKMEFDAHSYFTATEVAHVKPLSNFPLFLRYMNANTWVREFFPNYNIFAFATERECQRPSKLQSIIELPFRFRWASKVDSWLMLTMKSIWARRYPHLQTLTREKIFRTELSESRMYFGNFEEKILSLYEARLSQEHQRG